MSAEEENKASHRRFFEEMNKGNVRFPVEYYPPQCTYHSAMGDWTLEQFQEFHETTFRAFPDVQTTVEDQIAEGDKVVTRWTGRATHRGELQGVPPTGRQVTITGIVIGRFENGREVETWDAVDMLGIMQQIGAIPSG